MHPTVLLAQGEGKHSQGHPVPHVAFLLLLPFLLLTHSLLTTAGSAAELNLPGSRTVIYNRVTSEPGTAQPPGTAKIAIKIRKSPWPEEFTLGTDGTAAG